MNIKQYLERIGYDGPIDSTLQVLSQLQYMHLMHVPFENLDIHTNTKIDLSNLYDKIVTRKRGGFCYELNGLFYELLKEIGYAVKMVSARVYDGKKEYSPEFDHLALIVKINKDNYLVDVGFGEFSLQPILIVLNKETNDPRGIFKIEANYKNYILVTKKNPEGNFIPEYLFSEKERQLNEFREMCNYHQTNPTSHFMQKRICSLPTKNGRITLTGDILKITENKEVKEWQLNDEHEILQELWNYFGIKL
ncbi:arylamine N-acetyltransferase family protein [Ferruginibacter profundus]